MRVVLAVLMFLVVVTAHAQDQWVKYDQLGETSGIIDSAYQQFLRSNGYRPLKSGETYKEYKLRPRSELFLTPDAGSSTALLAGPATALTGAFLIKQLEDAIHKIIDHAGNAGAGLAGSIQGDLTQLIAQLKREISDVTKPISELNGTVELTVQRALIALSQTTNFIERTRTCGKSDVAFLMNGLSNHIHQIRSDVLPWKTHAVVTNIFERGSDRPYGVLINRPALLVLEGYNLETAAKFRQKNKVRVFNNSGEIKSRITGMGKNAITVELDAPQQRGNYTLNVVLYKRGFLGLGRKEQQLSNVISVVEKPMLDVKYTITPSCKSYPQIAFKAGEIHLTNSECNGDRIAGGTFTLPSEWTYSGHVFQETSQNGCTKIEDRYLSSNAVQVMWKCPEKGGLFCWGAGKWVHGNVIIYGTKTEVNPGTPISGRFDKIIGYNENREIVTLATDPGCAVTGYNIQVSLVDADGNENAITGGLPDAQGNVLGSNPQGASFFWQGTTRTLTVSTPYNSCGL